MRFDIDAIEQAAKQTARIDVGVRDDGSPVGFVIVGQGSTQYGEADRAMQIYGIKVAAQRNSAVDAATDVGAADILEKTGMMHDMVLKHCVIGWYGFTISGKEGEAEFTPENFARVMRAKPAWAKKLLSAIEDDGNFAAG